MGNIMPKMTVVLALMALLCSVAVAEARGGRTTPQDCEAGSADPDCPDTSSKPQSGSDKKQSLNLVDRAAVLGG